MTKQEAQELAARLTRIWEPVRELEWEFPSWRPETISCSGEWTPGINLDYYWLRGLNSYVLDASRISPSFPDDLIGRFLCIVRSGQLENNFPRRCRDSEVFRNLYNQFSAHYFPDFRRNCWLSGCPIEATAHEKIEWMQAFTRDEIEAWNLQL